MADLSRDYSRFEQIVARLLEANGFQLQHELLAARGEKADIVATIGNTTMLVEVKYYRTARPQVSLIESAAARLLVHIARIEQPYGGMLVVACNLSTELRESLGRKFGLVFIDRLDLLSWAASAPNLADELNALLEDHQNPDTGSGRTIESALATQVQPVAPPPPQDTSGTELCQELRGLKRGKATWASYERLCDRILRYLFPNDLHGWHTQKRTDDGLNRFDYVCRIIPGTDFWSFLIDHLNSRYVLFEFKNYTGKIKQGQVLTTEKYLLERGLRRVAIILSRGGADKNAIALAQGAMRESGKLMLILDDDRVCEMLHMKEKGEDPTDLLFDLADNFLLSLPR
ncbi:restriction endonuclease [uncultured Luteimonas sp.]|uniref:restriction endonuclease n=1 Tax=uncultured Luteimonas sp. TaxID=453144 RepID=UPI002604FE76|nr:restriction endonuclease [uncultured Luteimonas sp.]